MQVLDFWSSKRNESRRVDLMRKLLRKYAFFPERLSPTILHHTAAAVHFLGSNAGICAGRMEEQSSVDFAPSPNAAAGRQDAAVSRARGSSQKAFTHAAVYDSSRPVISPQPKRNRALRCCVEGHMAGPPSHRRILKFLSRPTLRVFTPPPLQM